MRTRTTVLLAVALALALIGPSAGAEDSKPGRSPLVVAVDLLADLLGLGSGGPRADEDGSPPAASQPEDEHGPYITPDG